MGSMTLSELISRFLAFCGGLTLIGGAVAVIRRWMNPAFKLRKRVDDLENKQKVQDQCNLDVNRLLEQIAQTNQVLCKSMVALLDHAVTGNGIEEIKKVRSELNTYLIEK